MSVPSRPSDKTIENIGFYYKAPTDNNLYKINNDLANRNYISDCDLTISTNGDVPEPRFEIDTYSDDVTESNLIFTDDDGTVRRYFIHGDEAVSDNFCENTPISDAEYQSLSADAKEFYCDAVGGKVTATSITGPGSQFDADQNLTIYEKNVSGSGAKFQAIISNPSFSAGLNNISNHDLAQVSQIIADVSDLDGVDYSLTPLYDFPSLSGQETAAIREKCRYFIRDIYYRYLGREADESGLFYYANKIYDIFVSCAFGDCKYWLVNDLVVQEIRNSPEGLQYQERLKAGTVTKPEYALTSFGVYTQPEKWKAMWGNKFFAESFRASGGGKLIEVKIDQGGSGYRVGDTFGVSQPNNSNAKDAEFKITNIDTSGSDRFLAQPVCTIVREISRPVGVEIWNSQDDDSDNTTDCATNGSFINKAIVEGTVGGTVFGSGPYSNSSDIATAAVHAGLIQPGQFAEIAWYSASSDLIANFSGSTKNGVTSYSSDTIVSGVLKNIEITTAGNLANSTTTVKPKQVNGSGAEIVIQLNASFNVVSVSVPIGGNSYKVGDTFEVVSSYDGVNENPAILTVTEVGDVTVSGSCGIDLKLNRIISPDDDVCENPTEILTLVVDSDNPESNLRYLVEKEIGLAYADSSRDRIIDQVQDIDGSGSSDIVLTESANLTLNLFMEKISRLPSVVEFQQYTRFYYGTGGVETEELLRQFYAQFRDELDVKYQVTSVTSKCDRIDDQTEDGPETPPPSGPDYGDDNCVYDRTTFFNPGMHGTSLTDLWNFLGRPANQNSVQDNEPDMSDFAGMTLQRWKPCTNPSIPDLGGIVYDVVPYQGLSSGSSCVNEQLTTNLAIYDVSSRVLYNNGSQVITNLVSEATDPDAIKINQKYLEKLQRPAEQAGMEYWWEAANRRQETDLAIYLNGQVILEDGTLKSGYYVEKIKGPEISIPESDTPYDILTKINNLYDELFHRPAEQEGFEYWYQAYLDLYSQYQTKDAVYNRNTRLIYNNGHDVEVDTVEEPLTENGIKINQRYLNVLGRPAEKAGFEYWLEKADETNIDIVLNNINIGAATEIATYGGIKSITVGVDRVLNHIRYIAENDPNAIPARKDATTGEYEVYLGVNKILRDIEKGSATELDRGGVKSIQSKCEYLPQGEAGAIDLSWFTNTRLPPWWGTLSLAPPVLTNASRLDDTIYLINSPSDQTEIYKGFAQDNNTSNPKNQFELRFAVNWPAMTGEVGPGKTNPTYRKFIDVTWYKKIPGQAPEARARIQYTNVPDLDPVSMFSYPDTTSLDILNSNQSEFVTTLTIDQLQDSEISRQDALDISYDEEPNSGTYYYAKVTVENKPIDKASGTFIPGVGGTATKQNDSTETSCKFLTNDQTSQTQTCWDGSVIPITSTCPDEPPCVTKVCPDGSIKCVNDDCDNIEPPDPPPTGDCNSLSVSCGSNQQINVFTNSDTSITFNYRVNNANKCQEKGAAKVSIRRYWPCGLFSPASDFANEWLVQKKTVSIVNGVAEYTLKVNTTRDDYLPGDGSSQTEDDPGICHWIYVAYWEIDHSKISCRPNAWRNPGCDYDNHLDTLEEILCIQQQTCVGLGVNDAPIKGSVKNYEILNPYPDPRIVKNIPDFNGYPGAGGPNPATVGGNNFNWYYDCLYRAAPLEENNGDIIPNEKYEIVNISGSGAGFTPYLGFAYYQNWTNGPNGRVDFTKGCKDSNNDIINFYFGKLSDLGDPPGIENHGNGYAVGDIVEVRAVDQDPDTVPVRLRITEINPSLTSASCGTECPICEQTIKVIVADTTDCGPVTYPAMTENNEEPGGFVNNGQFAVGSKWFTRPNENVTALTSSEADVKTDSRGRYVELKLEADVVIRPAVVGDQFTPGYLNAVKFSGVDYTSLVSQCCGDNAPGAGSFGCNNFVGGGGCLDGGPENTLEVDCTAEVRVVAHWYYKYTFNNGTQSDFRLLEYLDNGQPANKVPEDFYPTSAGNNTSAMQLKYEYTEVENEDIAYKGSLYFGADISRRRIYLPDNVESVEVFLELKASNDEWGQAIYHPPPAGWDEDNFGIDTQVSSLRLPWRPMSIYAYGLKDRIFSLGKFSIGKKIKLPTVDWTLRIDNCATAEVYAPLRPTSQSQTFICGDKQSSTWYECEYSQPNDNQASETWSINGVTGNRPGVQTFGGTYCSPQTVDEYGTFADCIRKSDVVLVANTNEEADGGLFKINWNEVPAPGTAESGLPEPGQGECVYGLKILWYVDKRLRSVDTRGVYGYNFLSCGNKIQDLSRYMTDPERQYLVEAYVVLNNTNFNIAYKQVDFDWDVNNGDPYSYTDAPAWALRDGIRKYPINIYDEIVDGYPTTLDGKFWQLVLSTAGCTIKGNSGPGQPNPPPPAPEKPSGQVTLTVNGSDTATAELENGSVTLEFTAKIEYDQGGYKLSGEPNQYIYGRKDQTQATTFTNATQITWTETFTEANNYEIQVQLNKNFCPPGVALPCSPPDRETVRVKDSVAVTIQSESIQPTVNPLPATYSYSEGNCGTSVDGARVTVTQTIEITSGTGIYEWDDVIVSTPGWNRNPDGTKLTRSFTRDREISGQGTHNVTFLKANQEVYSERTDTMTWCVDTVTTPVKPTATAVATTYSETQGGTGCGLVVDNEPVEVYLNIEVTQGTGQYEWDDVTTTNPDHNYVLNDEKTMITRTIVRRTESGNSYGTGVIFLKNGQEVYRESSGTGTWCVRVEETNSDPTNPNQPPTIPGVPGTNPN